MPEVRLGIGIDPEPATVIEITQPQPSRLRFVFKVEVTDEVFYGECATTFTAHPDNKLRIWADAILERKFQPGEHLDTDELEGRRCLIALSTRPRATRAPGQYVVEVLPIGDTPPPGPPLSPDEIVRDLVNIREELHE